MNFSEILRKHREKRKLDKINKKKYNIFAVYHKPWEVLENEVVTPIHAGREIALNATKDGSISTQDYEWMCSKMIGDNTGINISDKNRYFAENSITYWMWKNSKSPYVGLMHYRRIFNLTVGSGQKHKDELAKYKIDKKHLDRIFEEYDIILPQKLGFDMTIYEQYKKWHNIADLDFCLDYIKNRYPDIAQYSEKIKTSTVGYFFNMFVVPKDILDGYADFLFDVLFAYHRQVKNREAKSLYQQRAEGYLAERLTGIYFDYLINTKNLKVKELPVANLKSADEKKEEKEIKKNPNITITRFKAKNSKGKGISLVLRVKL